MKEMFQIDFANIEGSINALIERGAKLANDLYAVGLDVAKAEIDCEALEGTVAVRLRETGVKVTEGHVASVVDSDPDVIALRKKYRNATAVLAKIRADLDCLHDTRRMLVAWINGQTKAGIDV